jgi:hypothetical protein
MTDDDIAQIKPGSVIRGPGGRRYMIRSIKKETAVYEDEIAQFERKIASLEKILGDAMAEPSTTTTTTFEETVRKVADGCADGCEALTRARLADPDAFKRYQSQGGRPAQDRIAPPPQSAFDGLVQQIMRDRKLPRHIAMQKARIEHPREFDAYQAGG